MDGTEVVTSALLEAPTFESVTVDEIEGILSLFEPVVNFFMNVANTFVNFMLSNQFLMISLAIITILAVLGFAVSLVRH